MHRWLKPETGGMNGSAYMSVVRLVRLVRQLLAEAPLPDVPVARADAHAPVADDD